MGRKVTPENKRDILWCLQDNDWLLVSHIRRKTGINGVVIPVACDELIELGLAKKESAKEYFPTSIGFAYHITDEGITKSKSIREWYNDPKAKGFH